MASRHLSGKFEHQSQGGLEMTRSRKSFVLVIAFVLFAALAFSVSGCATSQQIDDLQSQVDAANQKAAQALSAAETSAPQTQEAIGAADDAEASAVRSEDAADRSEAAASRAEAAAEKCEAIFNKMGQK